jgi:prepilin-type processing-associated H-X9-DG protein
MSEQGTITQSPKQICKWANLSLFCGIFGWVIFLLLLFGVFLLTIVVELARPVLTENMRQTISVMIRTSFIITTILITGALISGMIGLAIVKHKKGVLKGTGQAVAGISLGVIFFFVLFVPGRIAVTEARRFSNRTMCGCNLRVLGASLKCYAKNNYDRYPMGSKWCDLLINDANVAHIQEKLFVCPSGGEGRCHYAMNPNCEPNSPGDMVLLFETKGGWNQFGGPELLTFENHNGKGCNVLFNDGRVEFVTPKNVGKMKWKAEEDKK